ncbi:MAG: CBS domain-containing protein [Chloroflexota bacterium]
MTTVKGVMMTEVTSVTLSTSAIEVAQWMKTSGSSMIPVCENGKLRGISTERDIAVNVVSTSRNPGTTSASSVMSKDCPTVSPSEDIWHAINVMADRDIKVMPVVQDSKLVGLLSLDDLTRKSPALAAMVFSRSVKPPASNSRVHVRRR